MPSNEYEHLFIHFSVRNITRRFFMQQVKDPDTIIQRASNYGQPSYTKHSCISCPSNPLDSLLPVIVASFVLFINLLQIINL